METTSEQIKEVALANLVRINGQDEESFLSNCTILRAHCTYLQNGFSRQRMLFCGPGDAAMLEKTDQLILKLHIAEMIIKNHNGTANEVVEALNKLV